MRKITYYCDRCGKEIKADIIEMQAGQLDPDTEIWEQMPAIKLHFHLVCMDDMIRDVKKEQPKKKTKERGPHNPVNRGTVKALYEAGWDAQKIAEDDKVRCAESTVYKIIKELKEAGEIE